MGCYGVDTRKYIHPIIVEHLTGSAGADGVVDESVSTNWGTYYKCRSKIMSGKGRELFAAQQVIADATHVIEVLSSVKSRAITPKMRIKYEGRTFNIKSVVDINEQKSVVSITCVEKK